MIKPSLYSGGDLKGLWDFTVKLDGVRALVIDNKVVSRSGKPLFNLDFLLQTNLTDVEVFLGSWETTVSAVRSFDSVPITLDSIYSLDPLDSRLYLTSVPDPSEEFIFQKLSSVLTTGAEGLVLRQQNNWLKVKPFETYDIEVTGVIPGKGKYEGKLGAFITNMGNVGTGLTDNQRQFFQENTPIGSVIEVECMSLTPSGKFRHPRFKRQRVDK